MSQINKPKKFEIKRKKTLRKMKKSKEKKSITIKNETKILKKMAFPILIKLCLLHFLFF